MVVKSCGDVVLVELSGEAVDLHHLIAAVPVALGAGVLHAGGSPHLLSTGHAATKAEAALISVKREVEEARVAGLERIVVPGRYLTVRRGVFLDDFPVVLLLRLLGLGQVHGDLLDWLTLGDLGGFERLERIILVLRLSLIFLIVSFLGGGVGLLEDIVDALDLVFDPGEVVVQIVVDLVLDVVIEAELLLLILLVEHILDVLEVFAHLRVVLELLLEGVDLFDHCLLFGVDLGLALNALIQILLNLFGMLSVFVRLLFSLVDLGCGLLLVS